MKMSSGGFDDELYDDQQVQNLFGIHPRIHTGPRSYFEKF